MGYVCESAALCDGASFVFVVSEDSARVFDEEVTAAAGGGGPGCGEYVVGAAVSWAKAECSL